MKKAVLLIHGFAGELKDHIYLEERLKKENFDVYTFLLPGHEKKLIRNVSRFDWINECEKQLATIIKKGYDKIYVFGHSMGSLLAGYLATKHKEIDKLILSSPPYRFLAKDENGIHPIKSIKLGWQLLRDKDAVQYSATSRIFRVTPYVTSQLVKLSKERINDPKSITCPTLILEGSKDRLVPFESAKYAYDRLNTKVKKFIIVNDVNHPIFRSHRKDVATIEVVAFLKNDLHESEIINI